MTQLFKSLFPQLFNQLLFCWQQVKYARSNRIFLHQHPDIAMPDDYSLYESYQLNYKKYIDDGELTAREILDSVHPYLPASPAILDWGCGPARITRHLNRLRTDAIVTGSDTNAATIVWNTKHISGIRFLHQNHQPPLPFADQSFDLVIGFSVLTHIPAEAQQSWLKELQRILKPGGTLWITTHGLHFIQQLSAAKQKEINEKGIYSTDFPITGHRMMTSYHQPDLFRQLLDEHFELITHFNGAAFPEKAGKQDLWIMRKNV